jgi:hypothetical protein
MGDYNEKINKIDSTLDDVEKKVSKLEKEMIEFKSGFKNVIGINETLVETPVETPVETQSIEEDQIFVDSQPSTDRNSPNDSRNSKYNGSTEIQTSQIEQLKNPKAADFEIISIKNKIRKRIDYLQNNKTPDNDPEIVMLQEVLNESKDVDSKSTRKKRRQGGKNFTGGNKTRRSGKRKTVSKKERHHKKKTNKSHKKKH